MQLLQRTFIYVRSGIQFWNSTREFSSKIQLKEIELREMRMNAGGYASGQSGVIVNHTSKDFAGSNPCPTDHTTVNEELLASGSRSDTDDPTKHWTNCNYSSRNLPYLLVSSLSKYGAHPCSSKEEHLVPIQKAPGSSPGRGYLQHSFSNIERTIIERTMQRYVADWESNCLLSSDMLVQVQPYRIISVLQR